MSIHSAINAAVFVQIG